MLNTILTIGLAALAAPALAGTCGSAATAKACCSGCSQQAQTIPANYERASDIVDTAVNAGSFTILARALTEAGRVETLKGNGPFTVFAPTDDAFAKLPDGTLESLLRPENRAKLTAILTYHVVPGNVMAADVVKLNNATTVNGQRVGIKVKDGKVMVDGATVTSTDIRATNGVIHVIDTVILPK